MLLYIPAIKLSLNLQVIEFARRNYLSKMDVQPACNIDVCVCVGGGISVLSVRIL